MPVMATLFLSQSSFHTINHYFTSLQCSLPWTCTEAPCESPRSPCLHARFVMRAQEPTKLLHLPFWVPWVDCSLSVCQLVLKPAVVPLAHRLMFPQRAKKGHKLFLLKNLPEISKQSKSVKGSMQQAFNFFLLQKLTPQLRGIFLPLLLPTSLCTHYWALLYPCTSSWLLT